jgi:hypothetical protein
MSMIDEPQITGGMAGVFQAKKFRYGQDMGGFWRRDKFRI